MYRKIYRLRSQFEHDEIDTEQATLLLGSMLEQAEASENKGAAELAKLAQNWIDKHDWKKDPNMPEEERHDPMAKLATSLRDGTLLDELELLAFALAETDIETIEQYMIEKHQEDGYSYNDIEQLRDDGIITEQFTVQGNVFVWFKDWWGEEDDPDGVINEVGFLGSNGKPKIVDFAETLGICNDGNHAGHLKAIMAELAKRGI